MPFHLQDHNPIIISNVKKPQHTLKCAFIVVSLQFGPFSQHFIMKTFKRKELCKRIINEHPYSYHLDFIINMLLSLILTCVSIHPSIHPRIRVFFFFNALTNSRHQCISSLNTWACISLATGQDFFMVL